MVTERLGSFRPCPLSTSINMSTENTFPVFPTTRFQGPSTAISRPKVRISSPGPPPSDSQSLDLTFPTQEFACFSYDENHQYFPDGRSLRYYYPPRLGSDLCRGFEQFRQFDDSKDEHLDSLLRTIVEHEKRTGERVAAEVITWRGMMTKVCRERATLRVRLGLMLVRSWRALTMTMGGYGCCVAGDAMADLMQI